MRFLLLVFAAAYLGAQPEDAWKPLQFLTGEWVGDGGGTPGEGVGACSFAFDLQRRVMIRKSYAQYAKSRHDDLMVIYLDSASNGLKAIYFDSEDHVIRYAVESGPESVRFVSEPASGQPVFRLTYQKAGDKMSLDFEIAPPGKPFSSYLHATLSRKTAP